MFYYFIVFYNLEIFRKMRKPDPSDSSNPLRPKKRSSAAAVLSATAYKSPDAMDMENEADADTEARSSLEVPPAPLPLLGSFRPLLHPLLHPLCFVG
jgi:hypothetical protein